MGIYFETYIFYMKNNASITFSSTLNMWLFISLSVTSYISKIKYFYNIPICSLSNYFETSLCIIAKVFHLFFTEYFKKQSQDHCENMNCHVGNKLQGMIFSLTPKKWHKIKYQMQSIIRFEMQVSIVKTKMISTLLPIYHIFEFITLYIFECKLFSAIIKWKIEYGWDYQCITYVKRNMTS